MQKDTNAVKSRAEDLLERMERTPASDIFQGPLFVSNFVGLFGHWAACTDRACRCCVL